MPPTRLGHALERVPFLVTFAKKLLVYGAVIVLVIGVRSGWHLVGAIGAILPNPELTTAIAMQVNASRGPSMLRGFFAVGAGIFLLQIGRLVGEQTLRDIVFGRYHRSRTEERFFLFVDIAGSTLLAERFGPDAIHRFLGEVFRLAHGLSGEKLSYIRRIAFV